MPTPKTGRNDPCPCGSGKKYKKCCLDKDEAARRQAPPPRPTARRPEARSVTAGTSQRPRRPPSPGPRPPRELSPEEQWWDDLCARLGAAAGVDEQVSLAHLALAEGPPPDGDTLLEVFDLVLSSLEEAGRQAEGLALIGAIEARFPEAFREEAHYFAHKRFRSVLSCPEIDLVAEARAFGPHVLRVIDLVADLPTRLAWEGQVPALRALATSAWPAIQRSRDLMGWAVDEWAGHAICAVLLDHLEREPDLASDDPALLADLAPMEEGAEPGDVQAFVRRWIAWLEPGEGVRVEAPVIATLGGEDDAAACGQVHDLVAVVASRLRRRKGWSLGRSWVIVKKLGPLLASVARSLPTKRAKLPLATVLLPPPATLYEALGRRSLGLFSKDLHAIIAVVFSLPAWAAEVAARGWVSENEARDWLRQFRGTLRASVEAVPADRLQPVGRALLEFAQSDQEWDLGGGGPPPA